MKHLHCSVKITVDKRITKIVFIKVFNHLIIMLIIVVCTLFDCLFFRWPSDKGGNRRTNVFLHLSIWF